MELGDLVIAERAVVDLGGSLVHILVELAAGEQDVARDQLVQVVLRIVGGAGSYAVDIDLKEAVGLLNAHNGVLVAIVDRSLAGGANAVYLKVGHAVRVDSQLVCALLLHQRAVPGGVDVGVHGETGHGLKRVLLVGKLLGIGGQAGRTARRHQIALVEVQRVGTTLDGVTGHIGDAGNRDLKLVTVFGRLLKGDVVGDVVRGALHLIGGNVLAVNGELGVALDLLVHTDDELGLAIFRLPVMGNGANRRTRRVLLLGNANGKGLLGLEVPRHVLSVRQRADLGNRGGGTACLHVVALDHIVEGVALIAMDAQRCIVHGEFEVLGLVPVRVADGEDALVAVETGIAVRAKGAVAVDLNRGRRL